MPLPRPRLLTFALLVVAAPAAQAQGAPPVANLDSAWAAISRSYWDTLFIRDRWRATYDSLRRTVADADDERVRDAIRALIAVPGASHFALLPAEAVPVARSGGAASAPGARPGGLGLEARMVGDTVVVWRVAAGGPAARAGIRAGMTLTHVDSTAIDSVRARILGAVPGDRTKALRLLNQWVTARLGGSAGDTVALSVAEPGGAPRRHALSLEPLRGQLTQFGNLPPVVVRATADSVDIGAPRRAPVVSFTAWLPAVAGGLDSLLFAARGAPGLVIDLRGNPGGVIGMLAGVAGHLLDSSVALGTMTGRGMRMHFIANPRRVDRGGARVEPFDGPVAILVDEFTGSNSEFFSAGLQALGRARVFGVPSAGQALPAATMRLPSGDVLMYVIADHVDAKGRRVEGPGVQPDEVVPRTRADLLAGRDAPLEAARLWLARSIR